MDNNSIERHPGREKHDRNHGVQGHQQLRHVQHKTVEKTEKYIDDNAAVAVKLGKPLVIEEFGLPRDGQSFDLSSKTTLREQYFGKILSRIGKQNISGANFWAFGGTARPIMGQLFWKPGDDRMADPRMEEQGLNSVFDSDRSTWKVINAAHARLSK